MFAASRKAVPPRCEHEIQAKKTMITFFFAPTRLLVRDTLPHGQMLTRNYFIAEVLPMLREENVQFRRKHSGDTFSFKWTIRDVTMARRSRPKSNIGDFPEVCTRLILRTLVLVISGALV
jgi:hypothetical protein